MAKRRTPFCQPGPDVDPDQPANQPDPAARPSEAPPSDFIAEDEPGTDAIEYPPQTTRRKKGE